MKKLLVVVGARPNFVKVTRFKEVAHARGDFTVEILHTGQHSDARMSAVFFEQFGMVPDHLLTIPDASPTARLGHLILALEPAVQAVAPDAVVVVGDVDSTLAAAIVAARLCIPLVHVESGLRNGDMTMPEEVNRILTDRIADHCFTTEPSGMENLLREGKDPDRIHFVGNTMIDTLVAFDDRIASSKVLEELGLEGSGHVLITIHRPVNVDTKEALERMIDLLMLVVRQYKVVFPVHPRTMSSLQRFGLDGKLLNVTGLSIVPPADYFSFQKLVSTSAFVITDSGGVQEETTYRGVPCLTLRASTERPVTIVEGTNELITFNLDAVAAAIARIRSGMVKRGRVPAGWDGHATERVFDALKRVL